MDEYFVHNNSFILYFDRIYFRSNRICTLSRWLASSKQKVRFWSVFGQEPYRLWRLTTGSIECYSCPSIQIGFACIWIISPITSTHWVVYHRTWGWNAHAQPSLTTIIILLRAILITSTIAAAVALVLVVVTGTIVGHSCSSNRIGFTCIWIIIAVTSTHWVVYHRTWGWNAHAQPSLTTIIILLRTILITSTVVAAIANLTIDIGRHWSRSRARYTLAICYTSALNTFVAVNLAIANVVTLRCYSIAGVNACGGTLTWIPVLTLDPKTKEIHLAGKNCCSSSIFNFLSRDWTSSDELAVLWGGIRCGDQSYKSEEKLHDDMVVDYDLCCCRLVVFNLWDVWVLGS